MEAEQRQEDTARKPRNLCYPAVISKQDGGILVTAVDVPVSGEGSTLDEALAVTRELLLARLEEGGWQPPPSTRRAKQVCIPIPQW